MKKLLFIIFLISEASLAQKVKLFNHAHIPNFYEKKIIDRGFKNHHDLFDIDTSQANRIFKDQPASLSLSINGKEVNLKKVISSDINLIVSDGKKYKMPKSVHYRSGMADFTFTESDLMGFISDSSGNYNIGKLDSSEAYVLAEEGQFTMMNGYNCGTSTVPVYQTSQITTSKCIQLYWETDYDLFVSKGSVANITTYIQGLFNQVQAFYANDGFNIVLKTLYINTTPDKYTGASTNNYLSQFGLYSPYILDSIQKKNSRSYGDEAMLIGLYGGGGIAWTATLNATNPTARMAYCAISTTYVGLPNYSWSVDCIAHELGHLCGSPHTHECMWNYNSTAIDGCSVPIGCANPGLPASGGTIMSYCHQTSVGKNLSLGFGAQPKQLIAYYIEHGTYLSSCIIDTPIVVSPPTYTITPPPTYTVVPPVSICPNPIVITCKITPRLNDIITNATGYTNYKYSWKKNGIKQIWTGQTVNKVNYKIGDILECTVTSSNAQTITKCYLPCTCLITIK